MNPRTLALGIAYLDTLAAKDAEKIHRIKEFQPMTQRQATYYDLRHPRIKGSAGAGLKSFHPGIRLVRPKRPSLVP
jgi:hypothetical protein